MNEHKPSSTFHCLCHDLDIVDIVAFTPTAVHLSGNCLDYIVIP